MSRIVYCNAKRKMEYVSEWKKWVYFGPPTAKEQMPNRTVRLRRDQYRYLERLCRALGKTESEILREAFEHFCEKHKTVLQRGGTVDALILRVREHPDDYSPEVVREELKDFYGVDGLKIAEVKFECEEILVTRTLAIAASRLPSVPPGREVTLPPDYTPKDAAKYLLEQLAGQHRDRAVKGS